jgi:hypothetical protein
MKNDFQILKIENRKIVVKGVGKMFFQDGFPISMSISEFKKQDIEVSVLHIADECMNNGWNAKTTINKLKSETDIDIEGVMNNIDWDEVRRFCLLGEAGIYEKGGYEQQREMIFNYLFHESSQVAVNNKDIKRFMGIKIK